MRVRRVGKRLVFGALVLGLVLPAIPGHTSGSTPVLSDKSGDVTDYLKHTQNSFRPSLGVPWSQYQYACRSDSLAQVTDCKPFDIQSVQVSSDSSKKQITFTIKTHGNVPAVGAPLTVIPAPFVSVAYDVHFATTTQDTPQLIGVNCVGNVDEATIEGTGATITYKDHGTCPKALDESKGQADGSKTVPVTGIQPVYSIVHPRSDAWLGVVDLEMVTKTTGCSGGAPACIGYDMLIGQYEGYSGFSELQDIRDYDPASQAQMGFTISGNTITMKIPWNPTVITADGDGMVDDSRSFPWPFGASNAKITAVTAESLGVVEAGVNTIPQINAVCPDDSDTLFPESQEPIRGISETIGNPFGTGPDSGDCIRGIFGLLTLLDWAPDDSFELRAFPRSPAYLPSGSVNCRYPIGHFPAPPAPVTVEDAFLGPTAAPTIDVDTSPFDEAYTVKLSAAGGTVQTVSGPAVPNPNVHLNPLGGTVGSDRPCGYTYFPYGLHYFDKLSPDVPM